VIDASYLKIIIVISILLSFTFATLQAIRKEDHSRGSLSHYLLIAVGGGVLLFRPFGSGVDDYGYMQMYKASFSSGADIYVREASWRFLFRMFDNPESFILFFRVLSCALFILKAFIIRKLCVYDKLALFMYFGCFFLPIDLTSIRMSALVSLLFISIYFFSRRNAAVAAFFVLLSPLIHTQGVLSLPGLLSPLITKSSSESSLRVVIVVSVLLISIGLHPGLSLFRPAMLLNTHIIDIINELPIGYHVDEELSKNKDHRKIAFVDYFVLGSLAFTSLRFALCRSRVFYLVYGMQFIGVFYLWLFASLPTEQYRITQYYLSATPFLLGNTRLGYVSYLFLLSAIIYASKYIYRII